MNKQIIAQAQHAIKEVGFLGAAISSRYMKKDSMNVVISFSDNPQMSWNDEYRNRLNQLASKLDAIGLRWAAQHPAEQRNHLVANDEDGQPWMLFNGGEAIDLVEA